VSTTKDLGPGVGAQRAGSDLVGVPTPGDATQDKQQRAGGSPTHSRRSRKRRYGRRHRHPLPVIGLSLLSADMLAGMLSAGMVGVVSPRVAAVCVITMLLYNVGGLYRPRLSLSVLDDLPSLAGRTLVAGALVTTTVAYQDGEVGRRIMIFAAVLVPSILVVRSVAYALVRQTRKQGILADRTLILGSGGTSIELAQILLHHPEVGLRPVGFLADDPAPPETSWPAPHLGGTADLVDAILDHRVVNVVVAFEATSDSHVLDLLRSCDRLSCEIFVVPHLYEIYAGGSNVEMLWGIPLIRLRRAAYRSATWHLKRVMDVLLSGLALVLLAPVLAVCALAVRISIGTPVIFRQQRVGRDGQPFTLLKFCSLRPTDGQESARLWSIGTDDRVTRTGRLLRRLSLDELPQLWNILRGDMSLVGPRPERPYFVDEFTRQVPRYSARHRVPVGLTGYAQVHGLRGNTSIADRALFDNIYIEKWSLWEDCKIILRTAGQLVRAAGR
jgi:exopolysaccharide biosynthesis polyprenyl glycosylphosphotransferase